MPAMAATPDVGVAVIHSVEWSPGQAAREGAGEFLVLLHAAKLQRTCRAAGLLAVGDHNGVLRGGGERALRRLAVTGVVVVRLAPKGEVAPMPDHVFVDAKLLPKLVEKMKDEIRRSFGADPQKSADFGRIVNSRHFERLSAYLKEGKVLSGGRSEAADEQRKGCG